MEACFYPPSSILHPQDTPLHLVIWSSCHLVSEDYPVSQKEIEVILTRQLATCLAMPIFVVDPQGTLLFYNEPAEAILGRRFDETGEMAEDEWRSIFVPIDEQGVPLTSDALPLAVALHESRPIHNTFWMRGLDSVLRHIEVTAFPLIGQSGRKLGAVAIFWESGKDASDTVGNAGLASGAGS
jgi:PAS domain-containing protein